MNSTSRGRASSPCSPPLRSRWPAARPWRTWRRNPEKEKTRKGAGYGAAAGAAVGLLSAGNNPFKSAMIGAAAGALVGGSVGYYMDKQEAKLRQQMAGTGVDVVRKGDNITLDMPGGVTFAFNSADLNSQFYPVLDKVAATLGEYDKTVIEVAGHTDSVGSAAYNQQLSEKRANSVAAYLASRGVDRTRMVTVGAGKDHPIASNETEEGRAQNRRVEITIVPVTQESVQKASRADLVRLPRPSDARRPSRSRRPGERAGASPPGRLADRRRRGLPAGEVGSQATTSFCSFLIAFASIWRMRSADTPYRSASSCSVALGSSIQRARRMARLRSSSCVMAWATRSLTSSSHSARSTATAGSESGAGR